MIVSIYFITGTVLSILHVLFHVILSITYGPHFTGKEEEFRELLCFSQGRLSLRIATQIQVRVQALNHDSSCTNCCLSTEPLPCVSSGPSCLGAGRRGR